jgi:hypothetical protein
MLPSLNGVTRETTIALEEQRKLAGENIPGKRVTKYECALEGRGKLKSVFKIRLGGSSRRLV